jgi:hypothetical protein
LIELKLKKVRMMNPHFLLFMV